MSFDDFCFFLSFRGTNVEQKAPEITTFFCLRSEAQIGSDSGALYCPHYRSADLGSNKSAFAVWVFCA
nr:MAG TPA: hypothetical protein [Caudoviricetes sp.]